MGGVFGYCIEFEDCTSLVNNMEALKSARNQDLLLSRASKSAASYCKVRNGKWKRIILAKDVGERERACLRSVCIGRFTISKF